MYNHHVCQNETGLAKVTAGTKQLFHNHIIGQAMMSPINNAPVNKRNAAEIAVRLSFMIYLITV